MPAKIAIIGRVNFHTHLEKYGASRLKQQEMETPFGPSNPIHSMIYRKIPFYVLSRNGEEGYEVSAPYVNARANIYALKKRGVEKIISISAPGSLKKTIGPGSVVLPDDVIDHSNAPHRSCFEGKGIGVIRMSEPFCPSVRALLETDIKLNFKGKVINRGVYACTAGPRLETRSEIKELVQIGADLVGMTLSPEVFIARELEMCYAALCYPVNYAEGIADRPYSAGVLFEGLASEDEIKTVTLIEEAIPQLILNMIPKLEVLTRDCSCKDALLRYKKRGDLSENFEDWF
jgi:5'-methylthioadenosine phosphorylase